MYSTRNDLPAKQRGQLEQLLNARLADALDLESASKQAHWNVKGPHFIALHELFDQVHTVIEQHVDAIAERITALGGTALGTLQAAAGASSLAPYPQHISDGVEHLQALSDRLADFGRKIRAAIPAPMAGRCRHRRPFHRRLARCRQVPVVAGGPFVRASADARTPTKQMVWTPAPYRCRCEGVKWTLRADGIKVPKVEGVQSSQATGGSDMNRIVVGVDIAKRVFQLHWVEPETGEIVALQLKREKFLEHFANRSNCLIGMEACGGSQHWARSLQKLGHEVKLLSARMVKPFVGGNKNDAADARGIWTAVQQPGIKAVAVKSEEQQAVLALHRMREQLVKFRTAQINGLRGLLTEYGEVMPQGRAGIKRDIPGLWGDYPIGYRRW